MGCDTRDTPAGTLTKPRTWRCTWEQAVQSLREHLALSADCSDPLLQKPGTELAARGSTGQPPRPHSRQLTPPVACQQSCAPACCASLLRFGLPRIASGKKESEQQPQHTHAKHSHVLHTSMPHMIWCRAAHNESRLTFSLQLEKILSTCCQRQHHCQYF